VTGRHEHSNPESALRTTGRALPRGRLFLGPVGAPLEDLFDVGTIASPPAEPGELRVVSPYAVVGRKTRVPESVAGPPGKVWTVWCVHPSPGTVWVADGHTAHPAKVTDLQIVVARPHLCREDELCCDTCNTHLGCRCPEVG
jgi:hypothetical protein